MDEHFLSGLGSTTRHNFRYYRKRFEAAGHKFVEHLSMEGLRSVALGHRPKIQIHRRVETRGI
jgi:hypothetical protein